MNINGPMEELETIRYNDDEKLLERFFDLQDWCDAKETGIQKFWQNCSVPVTSVPLSERQAILVLQKQCDYYKLMAAVIITELQRRHNTGKYWS